MSLSEIMIYLTADITELPRVLYITLTITDAASFIKEGGVIFRGKSADNQVVCLRTNTPLQAHQMIALRDAIAKISITSTVINMAWVGLKIYHRPSQAWANDTNSACYALA